MKITELIFLSESSSIINAVSKDFPNLKSTIEVFVRELKRTIPHDVQVIELPHSNSIENFKDNIIFIFDNVIGIRMKNAFEYMYISQPGESFLTSNPPIYDWGNLIKVWKILYDEEGFYKKLDKRYNSTNPLKKTPIQRRLHDIIYSERFIDILINRLKVRIKRIARKQNLDVNRILENLDVAKELLLNPSLINFYKNMNLNIYHTISSRFRSFILDIETEYEQQSIKELLDILMNDIYRSVVGS